MRVYRVQIRGVLLLVAAVIAGGPLGGIMGIVGACFILRQDGSR
jgi:hypothetical protein